MSGAGATADSWNVALTQHRADPRVLDLTFDSPVLQERVTNRVYLPDGYGTSGPPWPVLYYLHGTVEPPMDNGLLRPATDRELLARELGPGGGAVQTDLFRFETQLDRARFVMVAPDTAADRSICQTCAWIDGRSDGVPKPSPAAARTLQADTFLHEELYPLVERMFHVRADRAGRGVMGFSMGATGAYLQGFVHPDRYAFTAAVSGPLQLVDEPGIRFAWEALGYFRDQGYGLSSLNEADWRGLNPADLAFNIQGVDHPVFASGGDACLRAASLSAADCRTYPAATNPLAAWAEAVIGNNFTHTKGYLPRLRIDETRVLLPGVHGANNHRVYSEHIVAWANAVFGRRVADPEAFQYRSTASHFSVWGYSFDVRRQETAFLEISHAARDGHTFVVSGSGSVTVTTPARSVQPSSPFRAEITDEVTGVRSIVSGVADAAGRARIALGSGPPFRIRVDVVSNGA